MGFDLEKRLASELNRLAEEGRGPQNDRRAQERLEQFRRIADELKAQLATEAETSAPGRRTAVDAEAMFASAVRRFEQVAQQITTRPFEPAAQRGTTRPFAQVPWQSPTMFDDYRVAGLREVIAGIADHRLRRATLAAAEPEIAARVSSATQGTKSTSGTASTRGTPNGAGRAMWRAAERRAATLYRHAQDAGEVASEDPIVDEALQRCGSGQALPAELRERMETELGISLERVRVHTDPVAAAAARAVRASAFTVGEDIFFAERAFDPHSRDGQKLLAHELMHVVQAYQGRTTTSGTGIRVSEASESLEREAETIAERIVEQPVRAATPARTSNGARATRSRTTQTARERSLRARGSAPAIAQPDAEAVAKPVAAPAAKPVAAPARGTTLMRRGEAASSASSSSASSSSAASSSQSSSSSSATNGEVGPNGERAQKPKLQVTRDRANEQAQHAAATRPDQVRGDGEQLAQRVGEASKPALNQLRQTAAQAKARPPGAGAHAEASAHAKHQAHHEAEAHRAAAEAHAHANAHAHGNEHAGHGHAPAHANEALPGGVRFKQIDDWSKYMPAALPDQDERERARILELVKQQVNADRRESAQALAQLRRTQLAQAAAVRALSPGLQAQVKTAETAALGRVSSSEASQAAAVQAHVAGVQAQVRASAATLKGQIASAHAAAIQAINSAKQSATQKLTSAKTKALSDIDQGAAQELATIATVYASTRAQIVALGSLKAGVASRLASSVALPYTGDKLEAAQKAARDVAAEYANAMPEEAGKAADQICASQPQREQQVRQIAENQKQQVELAFTQAKQTIDQAAEQATQAAGTMRDQATQQLDSTASTTVAQLAAHGASQVGAIRQEAAGARSGITSASATAQAAVTQSCAQAAAGIVKGVHGLIRGARELEAPNPEETRQKAREAIGEINNGAHQIGGGLHRAASAQGSHLGQQAAHAASGMQHTATAAKGQASQMGTGAQQGMTQLAQGASQGLQQLAQGFGDNAEKIAGGGEKGMTEAAAKAQQGFTALTQDVRTNLDGAVDQLIGSFDKAVPTQETADILAQAKKAADAVKPWWQKALAVVVSVLVSIVVVVVVTALIVTTGPVGAILVGAAAGALGSVLGTMASNLVLGNGLTEGITWQSVAMGAIGGAVGAGFSQGVTAGARALAAGGSRFASAGARVATAMAAPGGGSLGGYAIKTGVGVTGDFVSDAASQVIVTGHYEFSMENLATSLVTNAVSSTRRYEAIQEHVQGGIQARTGHIEIGGPNGAVSAHAPGAPASGGDGGGGGAGVGGGGTQIGSSGPHPTGEGAHASSGSSAGGTHAGGQPAGGQAANANAGGQHGAGGQPAGGAHGGENAAGANAGGQPAGGAHGGENAAGPNAGGQNAASNAGGQNAAGGAGGQNAAGGAGGQNAAGGAGGQNATGGAGGQHAGANGQNAGGQNAGTHGQNAGGQGAGGQHAGGQNAAHGENAGGQQGQSANASGGGAHADGPNAGHADAAANDNTHGGASANDNASAHADANANGNAHADANSNAPGGADANTQGAHGGTNAAQGQHAGGQGAHGNAAHGNANANAHANAHGDAAHGNAHGDAAQGNAHGDAAQGNAHARAGGDSASGGAHADGQGAHGDADGGAHADSEAATQLGDMGYPNASHANADLAASAIESGGRPPADSLRDTAANQQGLRDLAAIDADPHLSAESKQNIRRDVADQLRSGEPTGNLARDVAEARAREQARVDAEQGAGAGSAQDSNAAAQGQGGHGDANASADANAHGDANAHADANANAHDANANGNAHGGANANAQGAHGNADANAQGAHGNADANAQGQAHGQQDANGQGNARDPNGGAQNAQGQVGRQPVHQGGLADPQIRQGFADSLRQTQRNWRRLSPQERQAAIRDALNNQMRAAGLPEIDVQFSNLGGRNGELRFHEWAVHIDEGIVNSPRMTQERMQQIADTALHEARHGEQWYMIARHLGSQGQDAATIAHSTAIPEQIVRAALADPRPMTPEQANAARTYYDSIYGANSQHRENVLGRLESTPGEYQRARADFERINADPNASHQDKVDAWNRMNQAHADQEQAYQQYRDLPEERDAWAVGNDAGDAYNYRSRGLFRRMWDRMMGRPTAPAMAGPGDVPRQSHADLDGLYRDAAVAQQELSGITRSVAEELGGRPLIPDKLKGRERAQQKIDTDYDGDPSRIVDLARSSIEFDNPQQIRAAIEALRSRGELVRLKDRFEKPADGYRDVMINIRMSNGHVCEVQLHLKAILDVKNGPGHAIYEQIREIDAHAKAENRELTPEESTHRQQLVDQQRALYDAAYENAQKQGAQQQQPRTAPAQEPHGDGQQTEPATRPTARPTVPSHRDLPAGASVLRQDNAFDSETNHKGQRKPHLDSNGNLVPANPSGDATILQHVIGRSPAKDNSPYSSFMTVESGVAKAFGREEIQLDVTRLQADIDAGLLPGVQIVSPREVQEAIRTEIHRTAPGLDIDAAMAGGEPNAYRDFVSRLGLSKGKQRELMDRLMALHNTRRDGEWLIKGIVPARYFAGPRPTAAAAASSTTTPATPTTPTTHTAAAPTAPTTGGVPGSGTSGTGHDTSTFGQGAGTIGTFGDGQQAAAPAPAGAGTASQAHGSAAGATGAGAAQRSFTWAVATAAPGDGNMGRSTVGLGERITFTAPRAGHWTASRVRPDGQREADGARYDYLAPATAGGITISFRPEGGGAEEHAQLAAVAPTGIEFRPVSTTHVAPAGVAMRNRVVYLPTSVSFAECGWLEVPSNAEGRTGYFRHGTLPSVAEPYMRHSPAGWLDANSSLVDDAGAFGFPRIGSQWAAGSFHWTIPNRYSVRNSGSEHHFTSTAQTFTITADGSMTVTKAGATTVSASQAGPAPMPTESTATTAAPTASTPAGTAGHAATDAGDSTSGGAPIQRKPAPGQAGAPQTRTIPSTGGGGGTALPSAVRAQMEAAFQADFSAVRIHEGAQAPTLAAQAYTRGTDIYFAPGTYDPDSAAGRELLGHELTHVVQQAQGRVAPTMESHGTAINDDAGLEHEADRLGAAAASGAQVDIGSASLTSGSGAVQRRINVTAVASSRHNKLALLGDNTPANPGLTVGDLDSYVTRQADWFSEPSLAQPDRDAVWRVLLLLREGPHMLVALRSLRTAAVAALAGADLAKIRKYTACFNSAAQTIQVSTAATTMARALQLGQAIIDLETFVPTPVMRVVIPESGLIFLVDNGKIPDLRTYYNTFHPTLETPSEWPHIEFLLNEGVGRYTALARWVHDLHIFTQPARQRLVVNVADTSRSKPVLLILMSASDWNSAFQQAANLEAAILNNHNLALVVQGPASIAAATAEVTRVANDYGQQTRTWNWSNFGWDVSPGRLGQVVLAGHGSNQSVEMSSPGTGATAAGDNRYVQYNQAPVDSSNPAANGTQALFDTIISRMDPRDANIVFAGCLVGSHDIPAGTNVSGGSAAAQANLRAALAANPNLADYVRSRMAAAGATGTVQAANGSTTFDSFNVNAAGRAGLSNPGDPDIGNQVKLQYVRTGIEPEGALRAAIECYADAAIGPARVTTEIRTRVAGLAGNTGWWETITRVGFELCLPPAPADVDIAKLLDVVHRIDQWFFAGWADMINVQAMANNVQPGEAARVFGAMMTTVNAAQDYLKVSAPEAWMQFDATKTAMFMTGLTGSALVRSTFKPLLARGIVNPMLPTLLPIGAPTRGQMLLALTIAVDDGTSMPAPVRDFLRAAAGGATTATFPAALGVPALIAPTGELSVLENIGLAPRSAPPTGGSTTVTVDGNVDANHNNRNETYISVSPREATVNVPQLHVRRRADVTSTVIDTVTAGTVLRVMGETPNGDWSFVDHNGHTGFVATRYIV